MPAEHSIPTSSTTQSQPSGIAALGINGPLLAAQIVNFLIVLAVLRAVAYKPLLAMLTKRRAMVENSVTQAKKTAEEARVSTETAAQIVANARTEATAILAAATERGDRASAAVLEKATQEAAARIAAADMQIAQERQAMRVSIERELGELVVAAARRVVDDKALAVSEADVMAALREEKEMLA